MSYSDICAGCKNSLRVDGKRKCQKCLDNDNFKSSKRFKDKANRGECYYCECPAIEGHRMCQKHLDTKRDYNRNRASSEKCGKCNKRLREKGSLCLHCWQVRVNYLRETRAQHIEKRLCQLCHEPAEKRMCESCRKQHNQYNADRRLMREQLGLCSSCGKEKINGEKIKKCLTCYLKDIAHFHFGKRKLFPILIEIFEFQKGICPYTGERLTLGVNASLDHKIPRARGGTSERSNLQWVYKGDFDVNWMKGMMIEEEFLEAIYKIYCFSKECNGDTF